MSITHQDFQQAMKVSLLEVIAENYPQVPELFQRICTIKSITDGMGSYDQSTSIINFKIMEEQENELDAAADDKIAEGYTTYAKWRTFTKKVNVSYQAMRDDKTGVIRRLTDFGVEYAQAYRQTRDQFIADHFNYGALLVGHRYFNQTVPANNGAKGLLDPTGDLTYDGKPWFAASGNNHIPYDTNKNTATYFNSIGALSPSYANLVTGWNRMADSNAYDEAGNRVQLVPDVLMCPAVQDLTWQQVLQSNILTDTSKNVLQSRLQILVNPYCTGSAWFLIDTRVDGLRFYERQTPEIVIIDKNNLSMDIVVHCRFGSMVKNWRSFIGADMLTV